MLEHQRDNADVATMLEGYGIHRKKTEEELLDEAKKFDIACVDERGKVLVNHVGVRVSVRVCIYSDTHLRTHESTHTHKHTHTHTNTHKHTRTHTHTHTYIHTHTS